MHAASRMTVPSNALSPWRPPRGRRPFRLSVEEHGIQSRSEILAEGRTDSDIRREVRLGELRRVANGWFTKGSVHPVALRAVLSGHRLTCVNAAELYGLWIPWRKERSQLHVYRARHAKARPPSMTVHAPRFDAWPEPDAVASLPLALRHAVMCQSAEHAAVLLESALHRKHLAPAQARAVLEQLPAYRRERIATLSTVSESGSETRVVRWLRHQGFAVEQQVYVEEVGYVDAYVAGVFLEIDGRSHHSSPDAFEKDRARDLALRKRGLQILRLSYWQVWTQWEDTKRDLVSTIRNLGPQGRRAVQRLDRA